MWFHSPPFLLRMEAWNQETKDNMNGMHSSCFHSQLQPRCCASSLHALLPPSMLAGSGPDSGVYACLARGSRD